MRSKREVGSGHEVSRTTGQGTGDGSKEKNGRRLGKKEEDQGDKRDTGMDWTQVYCVQV